MSTKTQPDVFNPKASPEAAYNYAFSFLGARWIEGESLILSDPYWAYYYARNVLKERWFEAESIISTDVLLSKFPVGSSAKIIEGLFTNARAMATR